MTVAIRVGETDLKGVAYCMGGRQLNMSFDPIRTERCCIFRSFAPANDRGPSGAGTSITLLHSIILQWKTPHSTAQQQPARSRQQACTQPFTHVPPPPCPSPPGEEWVYCHETSVG